MRRTDKNLLRILGELTRVFVVFTAAAVLVAVGLFPEQVARLLGILIPVFTALTVIEIYIMRATLQGLKTKMENAVTFQSFSTGKEFDKYLAYRFARAKAVKVIHLSSSPSGRRTMRSYDKILGEFIKSGGKFMRILSDTNNNDVFEWTRKDLNTYEADKFFIRLAGKIRVKDIRTLGIMIIDQDEVCLGGGYKTTFQDPTISIRSENIARFYLDYFEYLILNSRPMTEEYLNELVERNAARGGRQ